ncbi:MAG: DUF3592 domain-containing protein [Planctomycetes bacterium]|nr:DUF3592 domain-containing protein [Planctomycetota bacterium]
MTEFFQGLMGPLFLLTGIGAILWTWHQGRKAVRSLSWPSVAGVVGCADVIASCGSTGTRIYEAKIEYDYDVGGSSYRGRTVCIGGELNTSFRERAEARCAKYPVGAKVDVFYDPTEPNAACLERRREGAWLGYLAGNAFALFGLLTMSGVIHWG